MSNERQMRRGKAQAMYKYLPGSWIDFSVRGKYRKQYMARVDHWNSEKIDGINKNRLIRIVNNAIKEFGQQGINGSSAVVGFGEQLTMDNCDVLTPKVSNDERGIVAKISPLTFYCKECYKVYRFKDEESYAKNSRCKKCNITLTQFRQIYYCKCGFATDKHPAWCKKEGHGIKHIVWNGEYDFICKECKSVIHMQTKCPECGNMLYPKVALDPSQYFPFSLNVIDLINERLENFIANTDYGKYATFGFWNSSISRDDLEKIINVGIVDDAENYNNIYNEKFAFFKSLGLDDASANMAAEGEARQICGFKYADIINKIKGKIQTTEDNINLTAEMILEYDKVKTVLDSVSLDKAVEIAKLLNTTANSRIYPEIALKYGIANVQACDKIPFVTSSYGYTRVETEYKEGVRLNAFKEERPGRKNIYAIKMDTEGILFEFDRKKILEWLLCNGFLDREASPNLDNEDDIKLWFVNNIKIGSIHKFSNIDPNEAEITSRVYGLIHSISHLLIRAAADIGGLGKDSLSEYIFPSIPAVLIYCQNSQGFNLGALTTTFEAYFDKWIKKAAEIGEKCLFDPICLEKYKACAGCLFLNEISCEHFNKDLNRGYIVGYMDKESHRYIKGFWEE